MNGTEFDVLVALTGSAYDAARDRFLTSGQNVNQTLTARAAHKDWRVARTADMVRGWSEHRKLYEKFLAELDAVNVAQESKTVAGMAGVWHEFENKAKREYKADALPLWWEALLKHSHDWESWRVVLTLRVLSAVPDARSVEPLMWFIETTDDNQYREVAARSLAKLPQNGLLERIEHAQAKHKHILKVLEEATEMIREGDE